MKWCIVITFIFWCCTAQEYKLTTVELPKPEDDAKINSTNSRIIGGTATTIERFPYIVQVQYDSKLVCGGSLITQRHVLSAAHCVLDSNGRPVSPTRFTVRVGTAKLQSGGQVHSVSGIITHERYNYPYRDNNVAVLLLSSAVELNSQVATALIPEVWQHVPDNATVTHVGWGRTNANTNHAAEVLQEVTVRTIEFDICSARYTWLTSQRPEEHYIVTLNMICFGLLDIGGADTCLGDYGGPLVYQGVVVGVTSWGFGCGEPMFPRVNARVSAYTIWINYTITRLNAAALPPLITRLNAGPSATSTSLLLIMISVISAMYAS